MKCEISGLTAEESTLLLEVAERALDHGLRHHRLYLVDASDYPNRLRAPQAVFVTLFSDARLRGCVGLLESTVALIRNVAEYTHAAAFADPRFPQLRLEEKAALEIQVSVLSDLEPMNVQSEDELLEQLRPGIDGVLLEHDGRRSTFLPAVWKRLPDRERFLLELKHKAGLDRWNASVRVSRYTTVCLSRTMGL